jgi:glycylpeptide N-tetradecanoyltransferase
MLEHLKTKFKDNYKMMKQIDHMEPLYDMHDFWDSQPVPKAYETVDESMFDQAIDNPKTIAEVKPDPYALPENFYWADVDITDRAQAEEVYQLLT